MGGAVRPTRAWEQVHAARDRCDSCRALPSPGAVLPLGPECTMAPGGGASPHGTTVRMAGVQAVGGASSRARYMCSARHHVTAVAHVDPPPDPPGCRARSSALLRPGPARRGLVAAPRATAPSTGSIRPPTGAKWCHPSPASTHGPSASAWTHHAPSHAPCTRPAVRCMVSARCAPPRTLGSRLGAVRCSVPSVSAQSPCSQGCTQWAPSLSPRCGRLLCGAPRKPHDPAQSQTPPQVGSHRVAPHPRLVCVSAVLLQPRRCRNAATHPLPTISACLAELGGHPSRPVCGRPPLNNTPSSLAAGVELRASDSPGAKHQQRSRSSRVPRPSNRHLTAWCLCLDRSVGPA